MWSLETVKIKSISLFAYIEIANRAKKNCEAAIFDSFYRPFNLYALIEVSYFFIRC
jgi:hypothetical protein